ncbi:hypothetical protein EON80_21165 [bacterium]|nr:MAG: hypothetical protein EON80_21165 [bacterium]
MTWKEPLLVRQFNVKHIPESHRAEIRKRSWIVFIFVVYMAAHLAFNRGNTKQPWAIHAMVVIISSLMIFTVLATMVIRWLINYLAQPIPLMIREFEFEKLGKTG